MNDIRQRKTKQASDEPDPLFIYNFIDEPTKSRRNQANGLKAFSLDSVNLIVLIIVAMIVRLYKISQPTSVVFDEVHFGGFASKYARGRFFMDVHPPLAKLLITFAGLLGGFDGSFDFKEIGKDYLESEVPYVAMRLMPAILGIFLIPISYLTMKYSGFSTTSAFLVASLLIFENGLVTQCRLILLDSPLVTFTAFTVLMWIKFHNEHKRPFQFWWWVWLIMTGVGLGLTSSVKWVGLFTIATIGFSTIKGLWDLLGNLRVSPTQWTKHFMARALGLIIVPIALYMFFFSIHFLILSNSGDGDGFMSTEFRQTLNGNYKTKDTPIDVAYDSMITIKHVNTAGGYLHSHRHNYPEGSKQQQVTLYPHRDSNNDWLIQNITELEIPLNETDPIWVKDGSIIRLYHLKTHRRLHSHDIRPPLTDAKYQNEVSTYGYEGFSGDGNDDWRVEIADYDKSDSESGKRLRALHTKFRLRHVVTGCYLFSHSVKLPDWGSNQQEVTCVNGGSKPNTIWYIESNSHPKLPEDAEKVNYKKIGFFGKFFEINKVMWTTNSGLTGSHPYESRPSSWVLLDRGISFWGKDHRHIYLIGNPIVWWSSSLALYFYIVVETVIILRAKRGYSDHLNPLKEFYESYASFFFLGWFLHYFPFFLMARQLFLHHYFPALYFAVLLVGVGFDFLTIRLKPKNRIIVASVFIIISIYAFSQLSPLAYGEPWTKNDCLKVKKWGSRWDFDCYQFHDSYDQYYTKDLTVINNINNQTNIDISSLDISHTLSSDQQQKQENDNKESLQETKDDVGEVGKSIDLVENDNKESLQETKDDVGEVGKSIDLVENDNKENLQEIKNDTDGVDEAVDLADVIDNEVLNI